MRVLYFLGRSLQIMGLIAMPTSMWVAHFEHDEAKSISFFVGSIIIFFIGFVLTRFSLRS